MTSTIVREFLELFEDFTPQDLEKPVELVVMFMNKEDVATREIEELEISDTKVRIVGWNNYPEH